MNSKQVIYTIIGWHCLEKHQEFKGAKDRKIEKEQQRKKCFQQKAVYDMHFNNKGTVSVTISFMEDAQES